MAIIGWGISADETKYWLIKNSWGGEWGDQGCFRMKRGVNLCGIESDVWCAKPSAEWTKYRENEIIEDHVKFLLKQLKQKEAKSPSVPK